MRDNNWSNKLGNNFTGQTGSYEDAMLYKNMASDGSYQAKVSGDYGEFTAKSVLNSLPDVYAVMDDILLQTGIKYRAYQPEKYGQSPWKIIRNPRTGRLYEEVHQSTQLDHVVVSPFGIFVIETKNHKGWVFGDINGKVWTQVLNNGKSHFTFYNPVTQNREHIRHLSKNMKLSDKYMAGMIVFTNPEAFLGNVNCDCCFTLDTLYKAILSFNTQLFDKKHYDKVIRVIEKIDSNSYTLAKEHIAYVKDINNRHEINKRLSRGF